VRMEEGGETEKGVGGRWRGWAWTGVKRARGSGQEAKGREAAAAVEGRGQQRAMEEATVERTDRLMVPVFKEDRGRRQPGGQSPSARSPLARVPACPPATPPPPPRSKHKCPIKAQPTPRTTLAARPLAAPFLFSPAQVSPYVSVSGAVPEWRNDLRTPPHKHQPPDHTPVRETGPGANKGRGRAKKKPDATDFVWFKYRGAQFARRVQPFFDSAVSSDSQTRPPLIGVGVASHSPFRQKSATNPMRPQSPKAGRLTQDPFAGRQIGDLYLFSIALSLAMSFIFPAV
jgi:hypothetical protein